mmetsp:Transcript_35051/g.96824  ORF Transcript_35051/g.96824 Transcript_35051/m.96824 type:complete len:215 (+) Transcript_35051:1738-2382(+)
MGGGGAGCRRLADVHTRQPMWFLQLGEELALWLMLRGRCGIALLDWRRHRVAPRTILESRLDGRRRLEPRSHGIDQGHGRARQAGERRVCQVGQGCVRQGGTAAHHHHPMTGGGGDRRMCMGFRVVRCAIVFQIILCGVACLLCVASAAAISLGSAMAVVRAGPHARAACTFASAAYVRVGCIFRVARVYGRSGHGSREERRNGSGSRLDCAGP